MVKVEGLSIAYKAGGSMAEAVRGVSLEIRRGGISAIVGPSGCGKTSIVRALAGLVAPSAGSIRIDGEELAGQRRSTAVIFQDYGLLPWKTVEGNAELPLLLRGVPRADRKARASALLAELGSSGFGRYYPAQLSGGMEQRLAIARALAADPDLLLMDEPFSSLDALTRENLQDSLVSIVERHGVSALIVTHSIEEAAYLAERVYVMAGQLPGGIVAAIEPGAALSAAAAGALSATRSAQRRRRAFGRRRGPAWRRAGKSELTRPARQAVKRRRRAQLARGGVTVATRATTSLPTACAWPWAARARQRLRRQWSRRPRRSLARFGSSAPAKRGYGRRAGRGRAPLGRKALKAGSRLRRHGPLHGLVVRGGADP